MKPARVLRVVDQFLNWLSSHYMISFNQKINTIFSFLSISTERTTTPIHTFESPRRKTLTSIADGLPFIPPFSRYLLLSFRLQTCSRSDVCVSQGLLSQQFHHHYLDIRMCYHHTREPRGRQRMIRNDRTILSDCRVNVRSDPLRKVLRNLKSHYLWIESNQSKESINNERKWTREKCIYSVLTEIRGRNKFIGWR